MEPSLLQRGQFSYEWVVPVWMVAFDILMRLV
jgi:hypothetical protein